MKKVRNVLMLVAAGALMASCSYTRPSMVTPNSIGSKVGKSSGTCYFHILCFGVDFGLQSAAKNGGINKVATVDYTQKNVLGIIITHETTVTGE